MKKVNLMDWSDLLHYASKIGYNWNQAHDILVKDGVPPMYETRERTLYLGGGDEYGYSEDTCKIIDGFLNENNITEITIV